MAGDATLAAPRNASRRAHKSKSSIPAADCVYEGYCRKSRRFDGGAAAAFAMTLPLDTLPAGWPAEASSREVDAIFRQMNIADARRRRLATIMGDELRR